MKTISSKTNTSFVVRPPQENDFNALYKFAKTIEAEDTFITLNPTEPLTLDEEKVFFTNTLNQIKAQKKIYLLIFDKNKIIGSAHVEKKGRRQNHVGQFGISILKDYRSQGIGKKFMVYTIKLAQKKLRLSQITLDCFATNTIALDLYQKHGFKQFGRHPKAVLHQGKLIDKLLLYKDLT